MADLSEKYKRLYEQWLLKKAQQFIDDLVAQGVPAPSLEDAKKDIKMNPASDAIWRQSDEYKRLNVNSPVSQVTTTVTTKNRFSEMLTRRRAAAIREENPNTTEEDAFKEAEKDVAAREADDRDSVSRSKDPVAAKILLDISNTLMDIAENVLAIVDSLPDLKGEAAPRVDTLQQEELNRESKIGKSAMGVLATAPARVMGFFEKIFAVLTPLLLGFALALLDLNDPIDLIKKVLLGFAAFIAGRFLLQLAASVAIATVSAIFKYVFKKIVGLFSSSAAGAAGAAGGAGGPSPAPSPGPNNRTPGGPVDQSQRFGFLVKLANGIRDLGAGIGAAIASFFQGFATGLAAFGNPLTARGIATVVLATAAIGGLAYLFKQGDLKLEDFGMVGAGLVTLAGGLWVMSRAIPAALAITAAAKPLAIGLGIIVGSIAALGVALIPGAYAFSLFGDALKSAAEGTEKTVSNLSKLTEIDADALFRIGPAIMSVAAGLASFTAAMAIGTLADAGAAIFRFFGADSPMEQVLSFAREAKDAGLMETAKSVDALTSSLQRLNGLQLNNLGKVGESLSSLSVGVGKFSQQNVIKGLSGFFTNLLGKAPVDQIVKLSRESSGIYQAGIGVKSLGEGMVAFNSVDPKKVSETIKQVTSITEEQLKVLSKFVVIGTQIQQAQTLQQERTGVEDTKNAKPPEAQQPPSPTIVNAARGGDTVNNNNYHGPAMRAADHGLSFNV